MEKKNSTARPVRRTRKMRILAAQRRLTNIIFGRAGAVILLLLLQVLLYGVAIAIVQIYFSYWWAAMTALSVAVGIFMINRNERPSTVITWLLVLMVFPIMGTLLYFETRSNFGHRSIYRRLQSIKDSTCPLLKQDGEVYSRLKRGAPGIYNLANYTRKYSVSPIYSGSPARYYPTAEPMFEDVLNKIEWAESFIFIEFFIIEEGRMWGEILELLAQKCRAGVDVRVMYDGTCSLTKLPYNYPDMLRRLGIKCKVFSPFRPLVSTHYNNRDHRKILVVDGKYAFTGGANLADEYINEKYRFGHWKDAAVMLEGEAVNAFTLMFLQMWNIDSKPEDFAPYLNRQSPTTCEGYILPYEDCPLDEERVGEQVYLDMINSSRHKLYIMSPYLVLGSELKHALCYAAKRGVEVSIILPRTPDKWFVYALGHTYYKRLMECGVKIYEYLPGFIHSKVFVSDSTTAVVGSINLDYRSLCHSFECAALFYRHPVIKDIERDCKQTIAQCLPMTEQLRKKDSFYTKALGSFLRVFAPLI